MVTHEITSVKSVQRLVPGKTRHEAGSHWNLLYRLGGVAALLTAILIPCQIIAFMVWPPPLGESATQWFQVFHDNALIGLLSMDLLFLIDYVLLVPIALALYVALRRGNESLMILAMGLWFVAIAAYFASNTAFEMLSLSDKYAAATTAAERASYLGAGQALIATYTGTAFHVNYVLGSLAGIFVGLAMLRTAVFGRAAACAVIAGNVIGLGLYLPVVGLALSVISGPILWIWYILIGRKLWQMGK